MNWWFRYANIMPLYSHYHIRPNPGWRNFSLQADENALQSAYSDKIGSLLSDRARHFRDDTINLIVSHLFMLGGKESDSERTLQVGGALTVDSNVLPVKNSSIPVEGKIL